MKEIRFTVQVVADRPEGTDDFSAAQLVARAINDVLQDNPDRCYCAQIEEPTADTEIWISGEY